VGGGRLLHLCRRAGLLALRALDIPKKNSDAHREVNARTRRPTLKNESHVSHPPSDVSDQDARGPNRVSVGPHAAAQHEPPSRHQHFAQRFQGNSPSTHC